MMVLEMSPDFQNEDEEGEEDDEDDKDDKDDQIYLVIKSIYYLVINFIW